MIRCFPRATGLQPEHYAQPFDQALGSLLIYLFYMHATIRQKYMVFFHLIFLFCTTIRPKIRVLIDLFFMCTRPFDQKIGFSLIYCFYLCTTIRLSQGLGTLTLLFILFLDVPIFRLLYSWPYTVLAFRPLCFQQYYLYLSQRTMEGCSYI